MGKVIVIEGSDIMARKLLKCFKIRTIQKKKGGKTWQTKLRNYWKKTDR